MISALLANVAATALIMQPGAGNTQSSVRDPLEGGWLSRSANWVEHAGNNYLYHNEGGGLRKVMINTASPHDGNTYFTVNANVTGSGQFLGMAIRSPRTGDYPFYAYGSGADQAMHWYDSNNGSWVLNIEGVNVFRAFSTKKTEFWGPVTAASYSLNSARSEFVSSSILDSFVILTTGEALSRVHLRNGSEIYQFQARIHDVNSSANLEVELVRIGLNIAGFEMIASVSSSGSSGTADYFDSTITAGKGTVDNSNYLYYIKFLPVANTGFISARTQILTSDL